MLKNEAPIDRQIFNFPVPFKRDATPYQTYDFNKIVKESCSSHSTISGLKISKVIFMGDVSVGKTSLINRFCHNVFDRNYKATIGVDFEVERFDILHIPFNMQIWDTAGQEKFRSIASSYYRGAHIIAVVFDISSLITLSHCKQWIQDALLMSDSNPHLFLIGTKLDLVSVAAYNKIIEIASKEARRLGAELWVVSSNTGENVKEMFHRMAALAFDAGITREKEIVQQQTISIGNIENTNKSHLKITNENNKLKCNGCI
ncbi:ras-related protein Rab-34-like [Lycorma delicatula]|uniref:ras-related protein Rab-34-like n=1 Tax=Lycorma delicatula TaxID=130591 RepID=UPI003F5104F2